MKANSDQIFQPWLEFVRIESFFLTQMWSVKNVIGFALEFYLSLSVVEFKPKIVLIKITL